MNTNPDRDTLRDRVRRALCEASGNGFMWGTDMLEPDEYGDVADAVLAVLPDPTDRAAILTDAADAVAADTGFHIRYGSTTDYAEHYAALLRRLAAEAPTTTKPETPEIQVWPLKRVLAEVRCGSEDWTWEEEWADLDRRHADTGYLAKLEEAIRENGITMPVLVGSDGRLWDGHHRLCMAVRLGIDYVPVEIVPPAAGVGQDGAQPREERRG